MRKLKPEARRRGGATILSPKDSGGTPQVGSLVSCRRDRALAPITSEGGEGGKAARAERGNSSVLHTPINTFITARTESMDVYFGKDAPLHPCQLSRLQLPGGRRRNKRNGVDNSAGNTQHASFSEASSMYVLCREAGPLAVATRTVASTTRNTDS